MFIKCRAKNIYKAHKDKIETGQGEGLQNFKVIAHEIVALTGR